MSIISLRAKVKLMSESDMETFGDPEKNLGTPESEKWVWKNVSIPAMEIMMLIEYNASKTVVVTENLGRILVAENHQLVERKWKEAYEYCEDEGEEDSFNIKGENNSQEEDE